MGLKINHRKGEKIICVNTNKISQGYVSLTINKTYEILSMDSFGYVNVIDDDLIERSYYMWRFRTRQELRMDKLIRINEKRILEIKTR